MYYKKVTTKVGRTMSVEVRAVTRSGRNLQREKNQNISPKAMADYNEKLAKKKLRLLLNTNFTSREFHLTVTYHGAPPTVEEGKTTLRNFLRRAGRLAVKKGIPLKYIAVTEWKGKRIHHHIVLSGLTPREAADLWTAGFSKFTYLDRSGDYKILAQYLIKETKRSLREGLISRRWSGSRNLIQPTVQETILKRWTRLEEIPKEYKHYALMDWETRANPVTGYLMQTAFYLRI